MEPTFEAIASMELPKPTRHNAVVDNYLLGEDIGKGAYGQVYKAVDLRTGGVVRRCRLTSA